ncbi:MAG: YrbL family protein [Alkalilacustris sp.]
MAVLRLSGQTPLFETGRTVVHQDPRDAARLIKIAKPTPAPAHGLRTWRPATRRYAHLRGLAREQEAYIAALSRAERLPPCLAAFHGYCDTDLGIGWVVEKITDRAGGLAPTFATARDGGACRHRLRGLVDAFFDALDAHGIFAGDLHARNVLVAGAMERLVLVDGLGEGALIRLKPHVGWLRARSMAKRRRQFLAQLA